MPEEKAELACNAGEDQAPESIASKAGEGE